MFKKHLFKHGALIGIESSYGSNSPVLNGAADAFLLSDDPDFTPQYQHDGSRPGKSSGGYGELAAVAPSGLLLPFTLSHFWRGPGAGGGPYSSSVFSTIHAMLQGLGFQAAFTSGPAKWTYTPLSDLFSSLHGQLYSAKEEWDFNGGFLESLEIQSQNKGAPIWKFGGKAIGILPVDNPVGAFTYPYLAQASPKTAGMTFALTPNLGGGVAWGGRLVSWTLKLARALVERENQTNGTTHGGVGTGPLTATLDATIEATNLTAATPFDTATDINPYALFDAGALLTVALQVNPATQYSRYKWASANAQFTDVPKRSKNGTGLQWDMSMKFRPATDNADVDISLVTD